MTSASLRCAFKKFADMQDFLNNGCVCASSPLLSPLTTVSSKAPTRQCFRILDEDADSRDFRFRQRCGLQIFHGICVDQHHAIPFSCIGSHCSNQLLFPMCVCENLSASCQHFCRESVQCYVVTFSNWLLCDVSAISNTVCGPVPIGLASSLVRV